MKVRKKTEPAEFITWQFKGITHRINKLLNGIIGLLLIFKIPRTAQLHEIKLLLVYSVSTGGLASMFTKHRLNICDSFLDIRENAEWRCLYWPTLYVSIWWILLPSGGNVLASVSFVSCITSTKWLPIVCAHRLVIKTVYKRPSSLINRKHCSTSSLY